MRLDNTRGLLSNPKHSAIVSFVAAVVSITYGIAMGEYIDKTWKIGEILAKLIGIAIGFIPGIGPLIGMIAVCSEWDWPWYGSLAFSLAPGAVAVLLIWDQLKIKLFK